MPPLPDESDPVWQSDEIWTAVDLLHALAGLLAERRSHEAVGLILDRMAFGDPFESMRGMRHELEAAVDSDWSRLAEICVSRCSSERAGTRLWALSELGILREHSTLPVVLAAFEDRELLVAETACNSAFMIGDAHGTTHDEIVPALRQIAKTREALRTCVDELLFRIEPRYPLTGTIDHRRVEAPLARAIRTLLGDRSELAENERHVQAALASLLDHCLSPSWWWRSSQWIDAITQWTMTSPAADTLDVTGLAIWGESSGTTQQWIEPIHAEIKIHATDDVLDRCTLQFASVSAGLGAVPYGGRQVDPRQVTDWMFVFHKPDHPA